VKPPLTKEEIEAGLKVRAAVILCGRWVRAHVFQSGKFVRGQLRVNPSLQKCEAYVVVPGLERDVLISGKHTRIVALYLSPSCPLSPWRFL
jgi:hypothetical protein